MSDRTLLRTMVRGNYDLQKLRIETGNRLVANWRSKMGLNEEADETEAKNTLNELLLRFRRITDGIAEITRRRKYEYDGVISSYAELALIANYVFLLKREEQAFRDLESVLKQFPIYNTFLKGVRGCGPAMSGVIISEIDITRARYASSLWMYAGLDVAQDGRGRSKRKEHLIEVEYTNKNGEQATRAGITHNPFLKSKLVAVLGSSFLRAGDNPYREAYDNYKHRIENMEAHAEKTKLHRHNMAVRYAVKRFLADLYVAWRTLEGLPVAPDYHEAKLGHVHAE